MNSGRKFRQLEFRERVTDAILETLAQLPEAHRNIFTWSHYLGYGAGKIAEILGLSSPSVETTLVGINSILYQKVRSLLAENPQPDGETSLPGDVMPQQEAVLRFGVVVRPLLTRLRPGHFSHESTRLALEFVLQRPEDHSR